MTMDPTIPSTPSQTNPNTDTPVQDRVQHDLSKVGEQAQRDLDAISQKASEDVQELKHKAGEQLNAATDKAKSFAGDQKSLAADQINGVAAAITKVADELSNSDQPTIARYARDLASGLSGFGKTVGERDVDDLMTMAQDFGRRQPLAFLGAAALAGFVASRFAVASAHRSSEPYGSAQDGTGANPDRKGEF